MEKVTNKFTILKISGLFLLIHIIILFAVYLIGVLFDNSNSDSFGLGFAMGMLFIIGIITAIPVTLVGLFWGYIYEKYDLNKKSKIFKTIFILFTYILSIAIIFVIFRFA